MLHLIWSFFVGLIVGLIANAIMGFHMGIIMTAVVGIVGSIVGGLIARLFSKPADGAMFHPAGFFMSIIGAIILLFIVSKLNIGS